jgi:hypothetical protein
MNFVSGILQEKKKKSNFLALNTQIKKTKKITPTLIRSDRVFSLANISSVIFKIIFKPFGLRVSKGKLWAMSWLKLKPLKLGSRLSLVPCLQSGLTVPKTCFYVWTLWNWSFSESNTRVLLTVEDCSRLSMNLQFPGMVKSFLNFFFFLSFYSFVCTPLTGF